VAVAAVIVIHVVFVRRSVVVNSDREEKGLTDALVPGVNGSFVTQTNPDVEDLSEEMMDEFED
jgi:hypothetical protein